MRICLVAITTLLFSLTTLADDKDYEALQGTWKEVSKVKKGVEIKAKPEEAVTIVVKGNRWTYFIGEKKIGEGSITVDNSKDPKRIDLKPDDEGKEIGIYKIEKDTLTLCMSNDSKGYPSKFESTKDSNTGISVLKKVTK